MELILVDTSDLDISCMKHRNNHEKKLRIVVDRAIVCKRVLKRKRDLDDLNCECSVKDKIISEIKTKDVGDLFVNLRIKEDTRAVEIRLPKLLYRSHSSKSILEKLHSRFQDKVQISVCINYSPNQNGMVDFATVKGSCIANWDYLPKGYTCVGVTTTTIDLASFDPKKICRIKLIATVPDIRIQFAQEVLSKGSFSDVIITAGNGAEINGHKCFLSVCSRVLAAMLESGMRESQTGHLDMADISEEGVRALLRFVYYGDLKEPRKNIQIAYELLYSSHKYDVPSLEAEMMACLMERKPDDFEVEFAFKVYMFVRNFQSFEKLKERIVQILKTKFEELESSIEYRNLFVIPSNSKIAMEVTKDFDNAVSST